MPVLEMKSPYAYLFEMGYKEDKALTRKRTSFFLHANLVKVGDVRVNGD